MADNIRQVGRVELSTNLHVVATTTPTSRSGKIALSSCSVWLQPASPSRPSAWARWCPVW